MARRKRVSESSTRPTNAGKIVAKRRARKQGVFTVLRVDRKGVRALKTIDVEDGGLDGLEVPAGTIIRLRPQPGQDALVEQYALTLEARGAAAVKVMAAAKTPQKVVYGRAKGISVDLAPRQAILETAREAFSVDIADLEELCEEVMGEVGL